MRPASHSEVETLLKRRRARGCRSSTRSLFTWIRSRSSRTPRAARRKRAVAVSYNRAMRWMLVPYIRRWLAIAVSLGLMIAPAEAAAAQQAAFAIPMAAIAVACCIAITIALVTAAVYLLLGKKVV